VPPFPTCLLDASNGRLDLYISGLVRTNRETGQVEKETGSLLPNIKVILYYLVVTCLYYLYPYKSQCLCTV
jgi:hypothetical protein